MATDAAGPKPPARAATRSARRDKDAGGGGGAAEDEAVALAAASSESKDVAASDAEEPTAARRSARRATAPPSVDAEPESSGKAVEAPPPAAEVEASTTKEGDVSDASTETASDSDVATDKRKRAVRDDESVGAPTRVAKVAKDVAVAATTESAEAPTKPETVAASAAAQPALSPVVAVAPAVAPAPALATAPASVPTPTPATVAATTPTNAFKDLKRGADVLVETSGSAMAASASAATPVVPKAKRVRKTREEKLAILAFVDDGGTHVSAAEKFGVSRTAVTKMVKERDIIMSGLSGKQHAAVNSTPPAVAATLAVPQPQPAGVPSPASAVPDGAPAPPTRKTRASNVASAAASATAARPQPTVDGTTQPKAKRVRKTNEEKLLILEFVERGGSQGAAAEKFGVSRTAVTKMVKEREAITAQVMSGKSNHRKVLQYQHKLSIIEDMLYKWQVQVENDAPTLKITGDLLQSKAVEFRDKILSEWKGSLEPEVVQSLSDFKASNGWLHRYLQRRNLRTASKREYHRRPGPSGSGSIPPSPSDPFNINMYLSDITQRLRTVPVQCIWNMDEIALLPKRCVALPEQGAETIPMDRMTIALLVNAAGEKFKPEVLISEAYTEKLDVLQKTHPNLNITSQHYAWQDTTALALYLHAVSTEAKQRQETWFIVMDATPSHMEFAQLVDPAGTFEQGYRFENLVLMLLPPQATLEQHPIHHGIARVFKAAYRQAMLTALVQKWDQVVKTEAATKASIDIHAQIDASEEMSWVSLAWDALPAALIRHCWVRNGLLSSPQLAQISQDNSRSVEAELFRSLTDIVSVIVERDDGALAQHLGLAAPSSGDTPGSQSVPILDRVNALITLDDNEPTERKVEIGAIPPGGSQVITETDANGDLRALV